MGWREEIVSALGEWIAIEGGAGRAARWQRMGRAIRAGEPGTFVVDTRGFDIGPEQLDVLRLAGPEEGTIDTDGFSVSEAVQNGSVLTLKVAEFADFPDPHLWMLKQPPTFLIEALRDGLAGLAEAPLAAALAASTIGGESSKAPAPPGFHPAQVEAYRACLGTGVRLVWGPPGTGKTTVLKRAISDLVGAGLRVLLVSATNIAVDNALLGVIREKRHGPGDIIRVGPPQLREVADNPEVSLPAIVRTRLSAVEDRRSSIERELVAIQAAAKELRELGTRLVGFDPEAYEAARELLRQPGKDPAGTAARAAGAAEALDAAVLVLRAAEATARDAEARVDVTEPSRRRWDEADTVRQQQAEILQAAEWREAEALLSERRSHELRQELKGLEAKGAVARWRLRERMETLRQHLNEQEQRAVLDRRAAEKARATADAHVTALDARLADLLAGITYTREQMAERDAALATSRAAVTAGEHELRAARHESHACEQALLRVRSAETLVRDARLKNWPALHTRAEELRQVVSADAKRRIALERSYQQVQEEYERLARNAQGEIIKSAKLVATTLARFRTNRAVFEGPYDVVLIDEAGAATLPEVLLATGKATRTAVLLGDFMQLGPVIPKELAGHDRPDIRRWIVPDVFRHCGIRAPEDAVRHAGCVTLVEQHRFGQAVMRLANDLAYGGVLVGGRQAATSRAQDDPEIVLVDTDGLHELAHPHLTGSRKGWWPAGSLLSRALAELHQETGEDVGIVTPYRVQADATLEALRDVEPEGRPLAEVGTAHRFQGREFPVVIFDTVEGADQKELWMALARRGSGANDWEHEGARLFNVAVTRVRSRLYVISSGKRITQAKEGTAFARLAALVGTPGVRRLQAKFLIAASRTDTSPHLGEFGSTLAEILSRHVEVTDIHDELSFYRAFEEQIRAARASLWLWAPWVADRVRSLLPLLQDATQRGVRVTVFIRDDTDQLQARPANKALIRDLKAIAHTVVPMNVMHQKVAVIDERTVMHGSLNPLSQKWTREVMLTLRGSHFARQMLAHLNADVFSRPPVCGRCGGTTIEIRRRKNGVWFWRCYDTACKTGPTGRINAWNRDIHLGRPRTSRR